ncbi:MAG: calcium/sodium antiporter [Bacteroidales bacterium]|nr:calcium/sodium antiporter [Bacteroidales bacterium]
MWTWIFLFLSLTAVVVGAEILVNGSVAIAKKYKISDFIIGATIIGIGTSCPELVVSMVGAIGGNADIAIGNVVGSNICNILLILGATALITPVLITKDNLKFELPYCITLSLLLMLLALNFFSASATALLSRLDGWILLAVFAYYLYRSFRGNASGLTSVDTSPVDVSVAASAFQSDKLYVMILKVLAGLALLVLGSHFFVEEAVVLARRFGVSDAFISITVLAVGTSLPELAASIASAVKKNTQMALGNIIGSNIFNISFILGLCSQVSPLRSVGITPFDYGTMILAALMPVLFFLLGKRISRVGGLLMLVMYVLYLLKIAG